MTLFSYIYYFYFTTSRPLLLRVRGFKFLSFCYIDGRMNCISPLQDGARISRVPAANSTSTCRMSMANTVHFLVWLAMEQTNVKHTGGHPILQS